MCTRIDVLYVSVASAADVEALFLVACVRNFICSNRVCLKTVTSTLMKSKNRWAVALRSPPGGSTLQWARSEICCASENLLTPL